MKKCTKCKIEKKENNENFCWIKSKNRFEAQCRECRNKRTREIDALKPKMRKKRECKPDEYYKEYRKLWREKNREHVRKVVHQNYLKNREKVLERTKKYRQENAEKFREWYKKSNQKHPLKRAARKIFNYHIEKGNIKNPMKCSKCMKECKVEAHHADYSKPLEVMWLCKSCHAYEHRKFKE